jgi:hypothetical protein
MKEFTKMYNEQNGIYEDEVKATKPKEKPLLPDLDMDKLHKELDL